MSEGFLEGLSKQLHLSTPEKIAVGLALSDSGNTDFRIRDEQSNSAELLSLETEDVEKRHQRNIQDHPLFFGITLGLLAEIINSRLFTTVRDSLGLTYDVSFELSLFDRLKLRWYVVSVTSTPGKVYKAVDACKNVLRGLHDSKIAQRELDRMEVLLGKTKKFDDLMVAVAAKGRQLETIKHDGKP
ncbi:stromal processing peptidase, chloroplastic-like isoform X3 [Magnolia sinica]|nr:stromal processing peptidase, chloroplastic-like isoform X3 [Magnolia sinica]XP_058097830.1 stromal processing peptidase, chloroplastic-like isoform X3 [Magnolia sinica]